MSLPWQADPRLCETFDGVSRGATGPEQPIEPVAGPPSYLGGQIDPGMNQKL